MGHLSEKGAVGLVYLYQTLRLYLSVLGSLGLCILNRGNIAPTW